VAQMLATKPAATPTPVGDEPMGGAMPSPA